MTYTIVNHVIEYSLDGKPWVTFWNQPHTDEQVANWRKFLPGPAHRQRTSYRLVKRTAVITDEVLDTDEPDDRRQSYEPPNCTTSRPHDQHFHSPIGGLTLNCPGVRKGGPYDRDV